MNQQSHRHTGPIEPEKATLTSERYVSDAHFSKDGTFFHILKNSDPEHVIEIYTQDYFVASLKPYMHELYIKAKFFDDKNKHQSIVLADSEYEVKHEYLRGESSNENMVTISKLIIPPRAEITISFGVLKSLMQFEQYPSDPQRGIDVPQMPILYRFQQTEKEIADGKVHNWKTFDSAPMLVQTPEPDFSMPFNVNAVTNALLGIFYINMYNAMVKPKRFFALFSILI